MVVTELERRREALLLALRLQRQLLDETDFDVSGLIAEGWRLVDDALDALIEVLPSVSR